MGTLDGPIARANFTQIGSSWRIVCQSDRAAVSDIRGGIAQEEVHHLGRGQILDDAAHP
jgi:hypothetical protein